MHSRHVAAGCVHTVKNHLLKITLEYSSVKKIRICIDILYFFQENKSLQCRQTKCISPLSKLEEDPRLHPEHYHSIEQ